MKFKGPADVGGTYVGERLEVGNFSEQVWGDSDERGQSRTFTTGRFDIAPASARDLSRHSAEPATVTKPAAIIMAAAGHQAPPVSLTSQLASMGSNPPPSTADIWKEIEMPVYRTGVGNWSASKDDMTAYWIISTARLTVTPAISPQAPNDSANRNAGNTQAADSSAPATEKGRRSRYAAHRPMVIATRQATADPVINAVNALPELTRSTVVA
jgi:hypothetical protein